MTSNNGSCIRRISFMTDFLKINNLTKSQQYITTTKMRYILFILLTTWAINAEAADHQDVTIEISNIQKSKGQLIISFYNCEAQFPHSPFKVMRVPKIPNRKTIGINSNLTEGKYAIIVLDDYNKNNKMDYRLKVFPKEAFGFSNNARAKGLKRPSFYDCAVDVIKENDAPLQVRLKKL
jgi:uncharacterized protein (DUF2141 family)